LWHVSLLYFHRLSLFGFLLVLFNMLFYDILYSYTEPNIINKSNIPCSFCCWNISSLRKLWKALTMAKRIALQFHFFYSHSLGSMLSFYFARSHIYIVCVSLCVCVYVKMHYPFLSNWANMDLSMLCAILTLFVLQMLFKIVL
jgi:hypothetical protein